MMSISVVGFIIFDTREPQFENYARNLASRSRCNSACLDCIVLMTVRSHVT